MTAPSDIILSETERSRIRVEVEIGGWDEPEEHFTFVLEAADGDQWLHIADFSVGEALDYPDAEAFARKVQTIYDEQEADRED